MPRRYEGLYEEDTGLLGALRGGRTAQEAIYAGRRAAQEKDAAERLQQQLLGERETAQAAARATEAARADQRTLEREREVAQLRETLRVEGEERIAQQRGRRELPGFEALLEGSPDIARRFGLRQPDQAYDPEATPRPVSVGQYLGLEPLVKEAMRGEATARAAEAATIAAEKRAETKAAADFFKQYGMTRETHEAQKSKRLAALTSELNTTLDPMHAEALRGDIAIVENANPHEVAAFESRKRGIQLRAAEMRALAAQKSAAAIEAIKAREAALQPGRLALETLRQKPVWSRQDEAKVQNLVTTLRTEVSAVGRRLSQVELELLELPIEKDPKTGKESAESKARRVALHEERKRLIQQHAALITNLETIAAKQEKLAQAAVRPGSGLAKTIYPPGTTFSTKRRVRDTESGREAWMAPGVRLEPGWEVID